MPSLFQDFPVTGSSPFHGYYKLKNAASRMLLSVGGGSTANDAPIVDGTAAASDAWSFVRGSNGYYAIRNARSGKLINVEKDSGIPRLRRGVQRACALCPWLGDIPPGFLGVGPARGGGPLVPSGLGLSDLPAWRLFYLVASPTSGAGVACVRLSALVVGDSMFEV
jgi:hypothetical protein